MFGFVKHVIWQEFCVFIYLDKSDIHDTTVKPVLSGHSKEGPKFVFKTDNRLMQVKSMAECSHSAILSTCTKATTYLLDLCFVYL